MKANLKTEALIDLLDASRRAHVLFSPYSSIDPKQAAVPFPDLMQPMERSTPAKPGHSGNRRSSVIIRGDSTDPIQRESSSRLSTADQSTSLPLFPPPQPTRTRKANESRDLVAQLLLEGAVLLPSPSL